MSITNERLDTAVTFISMGAFCAALPLITLGCCVVGTGGAWTQFAIGTITGGSISLIISIAGGTILCRKDYWREKQVKRISELKEQLQDVYNNAL